METIVRSIWVALCLVGLCLAFVESSSRGNTLQELERISAFLASNGAPAGEPDQDLQLIIENNHQSPVAQSLYRMAREAGCEESKALVEMGAVMNKLQDQRVRQLLAYCAEIYYNRCKSELEKQLEEKLEQIGQKRKKKLFDLLSDSLIDKYSELDPEVVAHLSEESEIGRMFEKSMPLLDDYVQTKFKDTKYDPQKRRHVIRGARIVAMQLASSCPTYYKHSRHLVATLRSLVSICDLDERTELATFSRDFQNNVFRFKYCEEIVRLKDSKDSKVLRSQAKHALESKKLGQELAPRNKRSVGLVVAMVIVAILTFLFVRGHMPGGCLYKPDSRLGPMPKA